MNEPEEVVHIIIPPDKAPEIIKNVGRIYLRDCVCRIRQKNCPPGDWEVCLLFEGAPDSDLQDARVISLAEGLALLGVTAGRGAISTLFYTQDRHKLTELCNCCTCCCSPLHHMVTEQDYGTYLRSEYVAFTNHGLCQACGVCEPACPFTARQVVNSDLQFVDERCFGCGRCVDECPEAAIRLEKVSGRGVPIPGLQG